MANTQRDPEKEAFWRDAIRRQTQSGLTVREFCRKHRLSEPSFYERRLKRVAIGRKNWLFAGNDKAGGTAATLYTLIASAERHGVDPQRYLTSVLAKVATTPAGELDQFLPDAWKADDSAKPAY